MEIERDIEMQAGPADDGSDVVGLSIRRRIYRLMLNKLKRKQNNLKIRWRNFMQYEPSQESPCVRVFQKIPGLRQSAQAGIHVLLRYSGNFIFFLRQ